MSDARSPENPPEAKKGGFGAFAQQYRDRWAANHPNAKPRDGADAADPAAGNAPPDAATPPASDDAPGGSRA